MSLPIIRRLIIPISYKAIDLQSEAAKSRYWNAYERMRTRWYGAAEIQVKNRFATEAEHVSGALRRSSPGTDPRRVVDRAINEQKEEWGKLLQAIYVSVGETFAPSIGDMLNPGPKSYRFGKNYETSRRPDRSKGAFVDAWMTFILNYIRTQSASKVTQITDTTRDILRMQIAAGVENGETMQQISERIRASYKDMTPYRAETIARTEVINASNAASVAGAKASGAAVQKEWLASRDDRVRADHEDADGQTVPLDQPFTVGGYQLMLPGDSSLGAPAKEVVNCRCAVTYVTQ